MLISRIATFPRPLSGNATTNATSASAISLNETTTSNFTLPAWDGSPSSLAISVDKSNKRSIFYIGTDSELYQAANAGSEWQLSSRQNSTLWPKADNAKGELAVASNSQGRQLRVYYESGGEIMELNGDNNRWTAAAVLPNDNSTATTTSSSSGSASSGADASASAAAGSDGLSTGAKIGVGVGVSMGVVAVGGMLGALFFLRKRQQRRDAAAAGGVSTVGGSTVLGGGSSVAQIPSTTGYSAADGYSAYGPQSAGYQHSYGGYEQTGHELQGGWDGYKPVERTIPGELAGGAPAVHEMPPNHYHHEMMGEGHYREAP